MKNEQLASALDQTKVQLDAALSEVEQVKKFTREAHGKCFVLELVSANGDRIDAIIPCSSGSPRPS